MNPVATRRIAYARVLLGHAIAAIALLAAGVAPWARASADDAHRLTATAQILAGMTPAPGDPVIDRLAASEPWKEHQQAMQANWIEVSARLDAMTKWRTRALPLPSERTVIYPFSGPDFLNAHAMFPEHRNMLFFSLENPGQLPDLESISPRRFAQLLASVRVALRDIFQRNYFITDYMTRQLTAPLLKGVLPIIATMMALADQHILAVREIDLFPELTLAYGDAGATIGVKRPRKRLRGMQIDYVAASGGPPHILQYFSLDASDRALTFYPDFLAWVAAHRPALVFIKSASYLLHDQQFAHTRDMLLDSADLLIQDDTGIPFRVLRQAGWQIRLYGHYERPMHSLAYGYQADLQAAFAKGSGDGEGLGLDGSALPFPFGYHGNSGKSLVMIALRASGAKSAAAGQ